jgi:hypothetical protein
MKKISIPILIGFFLLTCCNSQNNGDKKTSLIPSGIEITSNEDKGIKEIIGFYGGRCEYGITKKISTNNINETKFWLKFSNSSSIDSLADKAELPGSNIAYLFYKNLEKEKNDYSQIESELIFKDGGSMKFAYTVNQLEKVKNKFRLADKIVSLIKNKDFEILKTYFQIDTSLFNFASNLAIDDLKKAEKKFGNIIELIPYGFSFEKAFGTKEILHLSGLIIRDKKSNYFSINVDPDPLEDKIYTINYNL